MAKETQTAMDILQKLFLGQIRLTARNVAMILSISPATIRTLNSRGTFPIPSQSNRGKRFYDIRDVAAYLDAQRTPPKRRGAPTKVARMENLEAARRGITVLELRAQRDLFCGVDHE